MIVRPPEYQFLILFSVENDGRNRIECVPSHVIQPRQQTVFCYLVFSLYDLILGPAIWDHDVGQYVAKMYLLNISSKEDRASRSHACNILSYLPVIDRDSVSEENPDQEEEGEEGQTSREDDDEAQHNWRMDLSQGLVKV